MIAKESSDSMLNHVLPASTVINHQRSSCMHGLKPNARPVLRGVCRLNNKIYLVIEIFYRKLALILVCLNPIRKLAYNLSGIRPESKIVTPFKCWCDNTFVDMPIELGVFVSSITGYPSNI